MCESVLWGVFGVGVDVVADHTPYLFHTKRQAKKAKSKLVKLNYIQTMRTSLDDDEVGATMHKMSMRKN